MLYLIMDANYIGNNKETNEMFLFLYKKSKLDNVICNLTLHKINIINPIFF